MPTPKKARSASAPSDSPWYRRFWRAGQPWYRQPLLAVLALPGLLVVVLAVFVFAYLFASVPLPEDIAAAATKVLDVEGREVGALTPTAAREDVPLESLPDHVKNAVLAAEDRSFYEHGAISVAGTLRALFTNVRAGEIEQGGSTITQQYIKNAALTPERTFTRKANEAVLAIKLEQDYSKDEVLEFYLNTIYFGRGSHGIESAAKTYFNVSAKDLTVNQAATLAGLVQAPERLDPADNPEGADQRRTYVIDGMVEEGWLEPSEAEAVLAEGLPETSGRQTVDRGPAAYYLDALKRELAAELGGEEAVYRGLTVHTEMDLDMQTAAQATLTQKVAEFNTEAGGGPPVSGAIVSIDPETGGVRALVGGPDIGVQPYNAALAPARNQPGSAFKPFGIAAFVAEGYSPESVFPAPATLTDVEFPNGQVYEEVRNFGDQGYGQQSLREATLTSTNTVFVQMAAEIGSTAVMDTAVDAGIPEEWLEPNPSLILGSSDVSALSMAEAYATFAAGGVHADPRLVVRVEDADGDVILDNEPESEGVIDSNVAYVVSDLLEQNIQSGTGTAAAIDRPAAGKTGTTTDSLDGWFVGYVPQLATAVWFGNVANEQLNLELTGSGYPAETWGAYMSQAVQKFEPEEFPEPDLSGLRTLNERPSPGPSSASPESPQPTECPDGQGGVIPTELLPGEPCPSPSPSPSPSPTPTTPTPTPSSPSPSDTPSTPVSSPSPTESATNGGGGGGNGSGGGGGSGG